MSVHTKNAPFSLILFLCLNISFGNAHEIKKVHYYMGGGGEPQGDTTIFDNDVKLMSNFIRHSDWETTVSFNGGHSKTEEIIKTKMPNARLLGDFSESTYNSMLDEMIKKIESGELRDGDQLMINIDSHGSRNSDETTHRIDLSNYAGSVSLDRMEKLANLAAEKGVKLAIMDFSCFSGNLLNIKNDHVCLISATGKDQYGYATLDALFFSLKYSFSGNLINQYNKGHNLEEIFLRARESSYDPDFPMISTSEGRAINDLIYRMISPYLSFNNGKYLDFRKLYSNEKSSFEKQVCIFNQNHQQLKDLLNQYEKLTEISDKMNKNVFSSLRIALENYRNYQMKYEKTMHDRFPRFLES